MKYYYAVFSSRNETLSFANYLKKIGVPCTVASIPKSAGRTCGISVRFMKDYLDFVQKNFPYNFYSTFKGFIEA